MLVLPELGRQQRQEQAPGWRSAALRRNEVLDIPGSKGGEKPAPREPPAFRPSHDHERHGPLLLLSIQSFAGRQDPHTFDSETQSIT